MDMNMAGDLHDDYILLGFNQGKTYRELADDLNTTISFVTSRISKLKRDRSSEITHVRGKGGREGQNRKAAFERIKARHNARQSMNEEIETSSISRSLIDIDNQKSAVPFMDLELGQCTFCVDDPASDGSANMLCCGEPVINAHVREGDRRRCYCAHHYEIVTDRTPAAKRFIKNTSSVPSEKGVKS